MSRIAFVSDIHSNQQALTAVLDSIAALDCSDIFCLGDIVGYGAKPNECLDLLRGAGAQCIFGNHDAMVTGRDSGEGFNERSRLAAEINRRLLFPEAMEYLAALPQTIHYRSDVLLCHGSPSSYNQYTYFKIDFSLVMDQMGKEGLNLCFLGHTHHPVLFDGLDLIQRSPGELQMATDRRYVINPGSVGQPRDRDSRASFVVWDQETGLIRFHRVEYDIQAARADIIAAGLPEQLGDRLLQGK